MSRATEPVALRCRDPFTNEPYEVEVEAEVYGGLWAVTPVVTVSGEPTSERGRWKVTHTMIGFSVTRGAEMNKKTARKLARLLARTCGDEWRVEDERDIPASPRAQAGKVVTEFLAQEGVL